jgi:hypothetical protein
MSEQDKQQSEAFADALDAPIIEVMAGSERTLPLMELDDLATIARRIANQQKEKALAALPLTASDEEKQAIIRFYNDKPADIDTVTSFVFDIKGAPAFIDWSLEKGGVKDPKERQRCIRDYGRRNGWRSVADLARRVSALFPPPNTIKGKPDPNPQAGQNPAKDETGGDSGSPSNESRAARPVA